MRRRWVSGAARLSGHVEWGRGVVEHDHVAAHKAESVDLVTNSRICRSRHGQSCGPRAVRLDTDVLGIKPRLSVESRQVDDNVDRCRRSRVGAAFTFDRGRFVSRALEPGSGPAATSPPT